MANAFVTRVVLNLATTAGLIERLTIDHVLPIEARERAARPVNAELEVKRSVKRQRGQNLNEMHKEIPTACDYGCKKNAKGYKTNWRGYKLHLDTADCGVPIAALLSSASMHDSLAAIPLSLLSASRVTNLYDVMDAGYT
jgi:hypothetical protein